MRSTPEANTAPPNVCVFVIKVGAYPRGQPERRFILRLAIGLTHKRYTRGQTL
jgi:hypothetical protein